MTDDDIRRSASCEGKISFETWSLAAGIAKRRKKNDRKGVPYKCKFCNRFHIGRSRKHKLRR